MSTETEVKRKVVLQKPPRYCNVFYNNDSTPFEFVIHVLVEVFNVSQADAEIKAQEIHDKGQGIVFISSKESCETKKELANAVLNVLNEKNLEHDVKVYETDE